MPRAVIVGAGIGGLTAAVALHRKGWEVSVYEAAPTLLPVGKGIWVPTNAMTVLDRLGLAQGVRAAGLELEHIQIRQMNGRLLSGIELNRIKAEYGHSTISIARAELVRVLQEALPPETIHLGQRLKQLAPRDEQVLATFDDGTAVVGDLLIGADGIHSLTREYVQPRVPLRYSGQTCFRGLANIDLPKELSHTVWEVWGGRYRFGFSAIGPGRVYWFAPITAPAGASGLEASELPAHYAQFPGPIPEIIAATPTTEIIKNDLFDFAPIARWHTGRIVLIGDAAHAMTPNLGQGGAQAIEDADVLAEQLDQQPTIAAALEQYGQIRQPKVRWLVNAAWKFGQLAHWENPIACWLRNTLIKTTAKWVNRGQMARMYRVS